MLMFRNKALDCLKVILAFIVVALHCNFLKDISLTAWFITVNGLFRIAVPTFMLINGYFFYFFLLNKKTRIWFKRMIFLYTIWMLFYIYWWFKNPFSFHNFVKIISVLTLGYCHLWYIISIIQAALLLYIFRNLSDIKLFFVSLLCFLIGVIIQYMQNYNMIDLFFSVKSISFHRNFLFFSFPFFTLGYLLSKNKDYLLIIDKKFLLIFLFIAIFLLLLESYINFLYLKEKNFYKYFDQYFSLILITPILFVYFISMNKYTSTRFLGELANSIYLIHIFCLYLLKRILNTDYGTLLTFCCIDLSFILSIFLLKINNMLHDKLHIRII